MPKFLTPLSAIAAAGLIASAVTSCRSGVGQHTAARRPSSASRTPAHDSATSSGTVALNASGTIYPSDVEPQPLARALCEALHVLPARRRAACCGSQATRPLFDECVRVVSASLAFHAVELDERVVAECARSMEQSLVGCDWVTPGEPLAPAACQGVFGGKLATGSVCRSSLECAGQLRCEGVSPTRTGICTPPAVIGAGCGSHVDVMAAYTLQRHLETSHPFCADFCSLVSHKCEPTPKVGAACFAGANCAEGQTCVLGKCSAAPPGRAGESCRNAACGPGLRCVGGACTELAKPGQACASDVDCASGGCVTGSEGERVCTLKCTASLPGADNGGPGMRLPLRPRQGPGHW